MGRNHRHQQEPGPHRETGRNEEMEDICQLRGLRGQLFNRRMDGLVW